MRSRHIRPHDLHQVVEQQTKGALKRGPLRRGANKGLERKDFRDLLKDLLDTPTGQVEGKQVIGRELGGVEQIGKENNRLFPRPVECQALPEATGLGLLTPQPAPVLPLRLSLGILPRLRRPCGIRIKVGLGMIAYEEMVGAARRRCPGMQPEHRYRHGNGQLKIG